MKVLLFITKGRWHPDRLGGGGMGVGLQEGM